ncbi:hypothetical protein ACQRC7_09420 [Segatella copri]|uniref:fimbrial tip adhesin FimD n=1 Tax=Segatella copri TaxID=165179 RepID=UPI003D051DE0
MKKLNKYRKSVQGLMLLTFGLTMAGCSAQDDFFTETSSESLSIKPSVTEATVSRAAVASDQTLREAALDNLYVKIFDKEYKEQSVNKKFDHNLQSNQKEILGQGNWKVDLNLQENKDYFVYSIANAKEDLTQVKSLADLETKVQTDEDIWKPDSSDNATKNFLMTANSLWTVSKEPTQTIESNLTRAAAKIVVNLKINVADYEVVGVPTWQLLNYNTQTTLFDPNTAKSIASMSETETNETMAKTADGYQLVTYSYATSWNDNASAPQAKIKVMLKKKDEEKPVDYYYSIPVRDPKATTKSLDRNHVYTANATVTSLGSSSDITYGDAMDLVYDVQKWTKGEETTINAGDQKYLLVSPTFMIMKNQRFDNSTIKFYGSGECTVETSEIYYYDKNGKKQNLYSGSRQYFNASANYAVGHDKLKDQGTIVIGDENNKTNDFVPLSVKYIKIKVTCEGVEDPVYVTIKQYPLEYIQGIAGWYSTKDEFTVTNWISSTTYEGIDWQEDRTLHSKEKGSEDAHFNAKVKEEGDNKIYKYYDKEVGGGYQATKRSSTGDSNNRMYVVQITNTPQNSKYKIGHVTNIDQNTKLSSEDVVSPAFMLASQLGTVTAFTEENDGKNASEHCDKYVEVRTDGKKYTDWRLPTASEIGVITNYQYKTNQNVIDVVLAGGSYWALNGKKVTANTNNYNKGYVRCVRDLSPDEVKELENKNE